MAGKKIGAIIALDGEKEFRRAAAGCGADIGKLKSEMNLAKAAFEGQANSLEALKSKHDLLGKVIEAQKNKIEALKNGLENAKGAYTKAGTGLEQLKKQYAEAEKKMEEMGKSSNTTEEELKQQESAMEELSSAIKKGEENYQLAETRVKRWETQLNTANVQLDKSTKELNKNSQYMKEAEKATDHCATSIDEFGKKTKQSADDTKQSGKAVEALSQAIVASKLADNAKKVAEELYECVDASNKFESAITGVYKTVDGTDAELKKISDDIKEMSTVIPPTTTEIAGVAEAAGQLGVATKDVTKFSRVMLDLGETTNLSADNAASSLAKFTNITGMSAANYENLGSTIVALGNNFATTEADVVALATKMASAGKLAGMSETDILALAASMSAVGIEAEAGGTAMTQTMTAIEKAVASGGKKLTQFADIAGMTSKEFSNEWKTNSAGAIQAFIAGLGRLGEQGESATLVLDEMGLSGVRQSNMLKSLALASDEMTKAVDMSKTAWEENTALAEEAALRYGTTESKTQLLKNSMNLLRIEVGDALAPAFGDAVEAGTDLSKWATGVIEEMPWVANVVAGLTASVVFLTAAISGLMIAKAAAQAMKALNITLLSNPYFLAATAVVGLVVAIGSFAAAAKPAASESQKLADEVGEITDNVKELKEGLIESEEAFQSNTKETMAQYSAYQTMANRLYELNDALQSTTMSEAQATAAKGEMKSLVDQLNSSMPELNLQLDEQGRLTRQNQEHTIALIESMKQKALMTVIEEQLTELYKKQAEAQIEAAEAELKYNQAKEAAEGTTKTATNVQAAYNEAIRAHEDYNSGLISSTEELNSKLSGISKKYGVAEEELLKNANAMELAGAETTTYAVAMDEAEKAIVSANEAESEAVEQIRLKTEALGMTSDQIDAATGATNNYTESQTEANQAANDSIAASAAQKKALESLHQKFEEIKQSIQDSIDNKISLFAAFDGGDDSGLDKMLENLKSQQEGLQNWKSNMELLASEVGNTIGPELYNHLVELGPEASNAVQKMADSVKNGGVDTIKAISDTLASNLDFSGEAADSLAATQSTIMAILGEMGSSEVDFSILRESIDTAVTDAVAGWEELSEGTKTELENAIQAARESGAQIPDGLAESIRSGETSVADAIAQLNGSVEAQLVFIEEMAGKAGVTLTEEMRAGIAAGGSDALSAIAKLNEQISKKQAEGEKPSQEAGKKNTQAVGTGAQSASGEVSAKVSGVMQQAVNAGNSYQEQFRTMGANMSSGTARGVSENSPMIINAVTSALDKGLAAGKKKINSNSPSKVWEKEIGLPMAQGAAVGIKKGTPEVEKSAVEMAKGVTQAAKNEWDIRSPSGAFKKFGEYISQGTGIGIKNKSGYAISISKKLASGVYKESTAWMKDYKKTHSVSLAEEKKFWKQLAKTVKNDSASYKAAMKNATASDSLVKNWNEKINDAFDVSKTTKKGKETVKKDAKAYYAEISKAATSYIENQKSRNKISLQEEKYYWQQVKKHVDNGSQAYTDAVKKIKKINTDIKKETAANVKAQKELVKSNKEYGLSGSGLDMYKTYYNVSAKAEMEYWDIVRKQFRKGTAERIEADQKHFDAAENYNTQLKDLQDDYYEKTKSINEKLQEDTKNLTDEYSNAVKDRTKAIYDSFGLFDTFYSESDTGDQLLANLQGQVTGYYDWMQQLEQLSGKGVSDALMEELRDMGPAASATMHALNDLSAAQIAELNKAHEQKMAIAEAQAYKENEQLRIETENKIREITNTAQKEINAYKAEYDKASVELSKAIEKPLQDLAKKATTLGEKATAQMIKSIKNTAEAKSTTTTLKSVTNTVADGMSNLPKKGKTLGGNMLDGILDALNNPTKIKKESEVFVSTLEKAIRASAEIKSPSKRFKKSIGLEIPAGVAEGIEDGTKDAVKAGTGMIEEMLSKSKAQLQAQQIQLVNFAEGLNAGAGISAVNNLIATPVTQNTNVTVDNTEVAGMLGQLIMAMHGIKEEVANMKMVLDTGELVGQIADPIGNALVARTRGW